MWFVLSIAALICWSGSDLFSKIGCREKQDKLGFLKMVTAVGTVMGLHCAYEVFIGGTKLDLNVILTYLPVSFLYIISMAIGYLGLRYIELSISSPICNSSGALVAILTLITAGRGSINNMQIFAVILVCAGVIGLGIVESFEDEELRMKRQAEGNFIYSKSALALILPVIYCLLDALGTFADSIVLEKLDESSANCAYELTFFIVGVICFIYTALIKKDKEYKVKREVPKYLGAVCETAGQFAYIYALADSEHVMLSAPIISSYCVASVLWSRLFLKEKLSYKHYIAIVAVAIGIVIMGIYDA